MTAHDYADLNAYRIVLDKNLESHGRKSEPRFDECRVTSIVHRNDRRVLLLGLPGSGKSTAVRRIACIIAESSLSRSDREPLVPVLTRANELVSIDEEVTVFLAKKTARQSGGLGPAFDSTDLQRGLVTLIVDALDEIGNHGQRQVVIDKLAAFAKKHPNCRIILTSRNYAWIDTLKGIGAFERYNLSPIDWKETSRIIKRIQKGKGLSEDKAQELMRRLQDVHGLQLNPLLVAVFAASSEYARTDIPANITEIFKKFTETMLGRWDQDKGFSQQFHAPMKEFILKKVALEMHQKRQTRISLPELEEFVTGVLSDRGISAPEIKGLLDEVVVRSGLFRIVDGKNNLEFCHLLLQEFFAGRALSDEEVKTVLSDEWWRRCLIFFFGENPGHSRLLEQLAEDLPFEADYNKMGSGALSMGLGLQACYLIPTKRKAVIYARIVHALSVATERLISSDDDGRLLPFVFAYLVGRDAVACQVLKLESEVIRGNLRVEGREQLGDLMEFWQLVGLLEVGALKEALDRVKHFRPSDKRLLLALHLGATVVQHLRFATTADRRVAGRICKYLGPRIKHLRATILEELRGEILEIRKGEIAVLPEPHDPEF